MVIFIIILLFALLVYYYANNVNNESENDSSLLKNVDVYTLDIRNEEIPYNEDEQLYETNIAGITKHCNFSDVGIYEGIIFNYKENKVNSRAMAIVNMNGKLFGYISDKLLDDYYKWSDGKPVTCVIKVDEWVTQEGDVKIYGKVFAIKPYNSDFVIKKTNEILKRIIN